MMEAPNNARRSAFDDSSRNSGVRVDFEAQEALVMLRRVDDGEGAPVRWRVLFASDSFCSWLEIAPSEAVGADLVELTSAELLSPPKEELYADLEAGRRCSARMRLETRSGGAIVGLWTLVPVYEEGELAHVVATCARARAVERHDELIEATGRLAASVGHELNNPLGYASSGLEHIEWTLRSWREKGAIQGAEAAELDDLIEACAEASDGLTRASRIASALGDFTDLRALSLISVDLRQTIESSIEYARSERDLEVGIEVRLAALPKVLGHPRKLRELLAHLIVNAIDSFEGSNQDEPCIEIVGARSGGEIVIDVIDNGVGLPLGDPDHLFTPFVTGRPPGQSRGLGLTLARHIAHTHGGRVALSRRSKPETGTRARITLLPLDEAAEEMSEPIELAHDTPRARRVLLFHIGAHVRTALVARLGPEVSWIPTSSMREALELLRGGERWDAIVCALGEQGGTNALYATVRVVHPSLAKRVLFWVDGSPLSEADASLARSHAARTIHAEEGASLLARRVEGELASSQ